MSLEQIAHINEILDRIFIHLDTSTLVRRIQLVCKQWNKVADEHVDYTYNYDWPIRWAIKNCHLSLVNKLLAWTPANAQNPKVDPGSNCRLSIYWASLNGHIEVVNRLLQDPRFDISNEAISCASGCGHLAVVNRLL
jgi:hypothetical protein